MSNHTINTIVVGLGVGLGEESELEERDVCMWLY